MQIENIESVLRQPFPDAMRQLTNPVCVATTDGNAGKTGTTVTAMTAVSACSESHRKY